MPTASTRCNRLSLRAADQDSPAIRIVTQANSRLFLLVDEMRERQRRLSMILTRGLGGVANGAPLLFGGLYLAATGNTDATQQAFGAGVFSRLIDGQRRGRHSLGCAAQPA